MGALAGRRGRHRAGLAGAALVALLLAAAPADAARRHVSWSYGGGIAGITGTSLTVFKDRTARALQDGEARDFTLGDRAWTRLRSRLRAARFGTLERRYAPPIPVADGTYDTVRYRGRAVTVETDGDPPRRLERLIALLARIHGAHAPAR
jgi:hypothetical protein